MAEGNGTAAVLSLSQMIHATFIKGASWIISSVEKSQEHDVRLWGRKE